MIPRLLVIRGGAIGDFILTLPAIRRLRRAFPAAHLEVLGYQHIVALAVAGGCADAARSIEYGPLAAFFARGGDLDGELAAYFAGFNQIVSYLYDPDDIFADNLRRCGVRNFLAAHTRIDESGPAAEQLARPLERLALFPESGDDRAPQLAPGDEALRAARSAVGTRTAARRLAFHPGSGSPRKNWPVAAWAELGDRLVAANPAIEIVVLGGEADGDRLAALRAAWGRHGFRYAVGLPLTTVAGLLAECDLFVGHDSGIAHLAAAVGRPAVLLFGPTDPAVWAPANAGVAVLRAPDGRIDALAVTAVAAAVQRRLEGGAEGVGPI